MSDTTQSLVMAKRENNASDAWLIPEAFPSVWCSGCGIGIVVNTFLQTVRKLNLEPESVRLVSSGLSCTGKVGDYLCVEQVSSGDRDPFSAAVEEKRRYPDSSVVVFANDGDLMVHGVERMLDAVGSGEPILILFISSHLYHVLIQHKKFTRTPFARIPENFNPGTPFNLPRLVEQHGAAYIARWTPLHCRRISFSIRDGLKQDGAAFIEIISPCLMYFASLNGPGFSLDRMALYRRHAVIKNHEPTENLDTRIQAEIIIGKFVDRTSD